MENQSKTSPVMQDAEIVTEKIKQVVTSPVVQKAKVITMSFTEVISEVLTGKRVTRLEWDNKEDYGFMFNTILCIHKSDDPNNPPKHWAINDGDLEAKDWISF